MSEVSPAETGGQPDVDLFGAPVSQIRDRWGRPSFAKTKENQETVSLLRAANWSHQRIAEYIGCDEKTLRKHFSRELQRGADLIEGATLEICWSKAKQGNSPAIGRILDMLDQGRAAPPQPREPKPEREGKKEQLNRAASNPTDGWATRLQ